VAQNCKILWARGHIHAGGEKMVMFVDDKSVCESLPTYNAQNVITAMSLCPELSVKKGQKLRIESVYNLKKHPL
jgi:hypothetical protein